MSKYAYRVQDTFVNTNNALRLSANIVLFAFLYTFAGSFVSYVLYYSFDVFDDSWKKKGFSFQIFDILVEISIIALSSFWFSHLINTFLPIIPVYKEFVGFIDTYSSGVFFLFTIFIFLTDFTSKLVYIHDYFLSEYFDYIFPAEGSILDLSLRYSKEQRKKIEKQSRK